MDRYNRHIIMKEIGLEGQARIDRSRVLVVGAGGLGCPVLQYLAAAGVGTMGVVDFDVVEESNLQRQVLYGTANLGQNKALAAQSKLADLNPHIQVNAYPYALDRRNALELFEEYDIIVDGTDRISTRYLINDAALICDRPVVYGAVYKFEGQVAVFNFSNGPTYRCLFPMPPEDRSVANCSEVGVLGVLPGIIGSMQANEVLKIILGSERVLSGKLLCYEGQSGETTILTIPNKSKEYRSLLKQQRKLPDKSEKNCASGINEISVEESLALDNALFIDVRHSDEKPLVDLPNCQRINYRELIAQPELLNGQGPCIVFCASGSRSRLVVEKLQPLTDRKLYNLSAGARALHKHLTTN